MEICYSPLVGQRSIWTMLRMKCSRSGCWGTAWRVRTGSAVKVYSPVAGEITMVYETQHAIGIKTETGMLKSCCISASTPSCWGERRSTPKVQVGDHVQPGRSV